MLRKEKSSFLTNQRPGPTMSDQWEGWKLRIWNKKCSCGRLVSRYTAGPCLARVCRPELACVLRACTKHTTRAWLEEPASTEQPEWSNDLNWPWVTLRSTGWAWLRLGYSSSTGSHETRALGHSWSSWWWQRPGGWGRGGNREGGGGIMSVLPSAPSLSATGAINRRHRGEKGERGMRERGTCDSRGGGQYTAALLKPGEAPPGSKRSISQSYCVRSLIAGTEALSTVSQSHVTPTEQRRGEERGRVVMPLLFCFFVCTFYRFET